MKKEENKIEILDVGPLTVLGMRRTGHYREIAEMIPRLCEFAAGNRVEITGSPVFVCHESAEEAMEADKSGNADVEVAIPVPPETDVELPEDIAKYELPGGKMAKTIHKGPYEECGPAYEALFRWLAENGKELIGPTREMYLNDPNEVAPEEILTEIYAPVRDTEKNRGREGE